MVPSTGSNQKGWLQCEWEEPPLEKLGFWSQATTKAEMKLTRYYFSLKSVIHVVDGIYHRHDPVKDINTSIYQYHINSDMALKFTKTLA